MKLQLIKECAINFTVHNEERERESREHLKDLRKATNTVKAINVKDEADWKLKKKVLRKYLNTFEMNMEDVEAMVWENANVISPLSQREDTYLEAYLTAILAEDKYVNSLIDSVDSGTKIWCILCTHFQSGMCGSKINKIIDFELIRHLIR